MLERVRLASVRTQLAKPPELTLLLSLPVATLGAVVLVSTGRLDLLDGVVIAAAPWVVLAAVFRPDLLLLVFIAAPASFTADIQPGRIMLLVGISLVALLVTRRAFSLGLGTGLAALVAWNVAGHAFTSDVAADALKVNQVVMFNLTYYILWALLAFNLAILGELDGRLVGAALIMSVGTTLVVGLAGYGGAWFEEGWEIVTKGYLGPMVVAALGVSLARVVMVEVASRKRLGDVAAIAVLLSLTIVSQSRAVWISTVILIPLLTFRLGRRGYSLLLVGLIVVVLVTPTARQAISRSESGDVLAGLRTGEITTGRWGVWTELWERGVHALPWGNGFGYVWSLSSEELTGSPGQFESDESGVVPPHNDFVYLFAEFGVAGIFLFLFFWMNLFQAHRVVTDSEDPLLRVSASLLLGALVSGLVVSLTDDLFAIRPLAERFFPVFGFMLGLKVVERRRGKARDGGGDDFADVGGSASARSR